MTRATPKTPPKPQAPPAPVPDPLADLREPSDDLPPAATDAEPEADQPEPSPVVGLVSQDDWDEARRRAVVAMHADTTTLGFLHKGGACGCHYIAGVILMAVMPVEPEADQPEPGTLEYATAMAEAAGEV